MARGGYRSGQSATSGTVQRDAVIVRPLDSRLLLRDASASTELVHSTSVRSLRTTVGAAGEKATVRSYDAAVRLVKSRTFTGIVSVVLQPGGFAVVTRETSVRHLRARE